jgi:hypothetical protein
MGARFHPAISAAPMEHRQHDCGNVNDQRWNHPPQKCGYPQALFVLLPSQCDPISDDFSTGEFNVVI